MNNLQVDMYFNTAFRNIGLLTSISIALLTASRFFTDKDPQRRMTFVYFATIFLVMSILFSIAFLHKYYKLINQTVDTSMKNHYYMWSVLPILLLLININMLIIVFYENIRKHHT